MARVVVSAAAAEDIARLKITHRLPADTNERMKSSIRSLGQFPRLGTLLEVGGWEGFRFVLGPWRWMVIVYDYDEDEDRVKDLAPQRDGREVGQGLLHNGCLVTLHGAGIRSRASRRPVCAQGRFPHLAQFVPARSMAAVPQGRCVSAGKT